MTTRSLPSLASEFAITDVLAYDGLGSEPARLDVAVKEGRIAALRPAGELRLCGRRRWPGEGLALAPGFIDAHSHSELMIVKAPRADGKISQGVTTEVAGQCGASRCIVMSEAYRQRIDDAAVCWDDLSSFAAALRRRRPALNIVTLCGHNTLRATVMGDEERAPTAAELRRMREILDLSLRQGAAGFSSGLWYIPGKFAATAEVAELAAALRGTGKPYVTHLRCEGDELLESVQEAMTIARGGSGRLQISHLKTWGASNWGKIDKLLEVIAAAGRNGLRITADRYPYLYSGTGLRMILPPPYDRRANLHELLRDDPSERERLVALLERPDGPRTPFDRAIVCNSQRPENAPLMGLSLSEVGARLGVSPARACVKLLAEETYVFAAFGTMCAENMERILGQEWVACGSDSSAYPFDYSQGRAHPRGFGTFPKFFQSVRRLCSAAAAIRRMTSLPAAIYNIPGRGVLREGYHADLVLFDEERFRDTADFAHPHARCEGVHSVFVSGRLAFLGDDPEARGCHGDFIAI